MIYWSVFVRAVAVISAVPRHGRPTGSHLPRAQLLPVSVEETLRGEPGERDSIAVAPDLISCAAVAATVAPLPLRRTSFPLSLKMNENMHY